MALGLKYFARYRDIDGVIKEVRFLKEGHEGEAQEWLCMSGAVQFSYGGFDKMFEKPIIPSQARLNFFLKEYYDLTEFVFNRKTFFVEVADTTDNTVIWSGWVEPWNAQRPHKKLPWPVSLTASCGLAHLSRKKYLNKTNTFKKTGLAIIRECLETIGSTLPLRVSTHMVETTWGGDDRLGLNSFEINTARYYDQNGEAMYCDVIINDILNHFNAELTQDDNRWAIRSVVDNATGKYDSYIDIDDPGAPFTWPFTYPINGLPGSGQTSSGDTIDGGTVRILPPINKYRTEIDFGTQLPFFENGNMVLWTDNGLVGWDFTHMAKSATNGWERFEVGGEISRGVLKINGKSPLPYRKLKPKKRKNQWLKNLLVLPLLVDAIGIIKKNGSMDVEPVEYIESPGGTISKGDKSVTVSFDYETEAFSSDILISIRIPVTQSATGKVVNFWVDPSTNPALAGADKSTAGASEEFCLIRIPPVDMGKLTSKGTIDVSGNPNYPSANFTPGSKSTDWTWTVTGVPAGEYRRIGGINGVLVSNGDLVIARVPNNGGSQAEVGGNWEVISITNNTKKGTFSLSVALNTVFITKAGEPFPADKVYIRFYKMADDKNLPGDWYKVYNVNGALEGFVAKEESARYATTLERGDVTDEEAATIQLISGDYNAWYAGSWTKPGSIENTRSWRRRPDLNEGFSIYRAMMLDRLCLTSRPVRVIESSIKLAPGAPRLRFLHTLLMRDMDSIRMRITRYEYNDYSRTVTFTAIEVKYEEIPREELRQDAYIPGSRQLNTVPGEGDGIYPSKQDSTSGRLNAEDLPLTEQELYDSLAANSRLAALFENIPPLIFTAGELSTQSVNLTKYLSKIVIYNNENQEVEDQFDFNTLKWETLKKPAWVTAQSIVFLNASVTGKPLYVGKDSITFKVGERPEELTAEEEAEQLAEQLELEEWAEENGITLPPVEEFYVEVTIPIEVYPKTILVHELLDTSGPLPVTIGPLPGVYPLPAKWDIRTRIKGMHDWWQQTLFGGGAAGNDPMRNVSQNVILTDDGIYRMFEEENGIVTAAGQYRKFTTTSVTQAILSRNNIVFTLYDGDFLAAGGFFLRKGGVNIAPISLDGTSIFENPEGCEVVFVTEGEDHNKVTLKITTKDEQPVGDNVYTPVTTDEGTYAFFGEDRALANNIYTIYASIYLDDVEVVERFTDFQLVKRKPEAEGGQLTLVEKVPGSLNFKFLATLPKSGSEHELPDPGFNVKATGESDPFDWEGWTYQVIRGGMLVTIDLSKYTGQPQFLTYNYPVTESQLLIFGTLSSLAIDAIHEEDTTHRVIVTRRLGGATGEVSAILQADFSFGTFQDPDEVPDEDDASNIVDYIARDGLGEEVIDYVKYFDVLYDGLTIGLNLDNELEVIEDSILFKHIQPIGPMTVMGNLTGGTINPYAVTVVDLMEEAEIGDLITAIAIKNYVTTQLENSITGTIGFFPIYQTIHTFTDSIVRQVASKVGFGISPTEVVHVAGNILATGQLKSTIATGVSPLTVNSSTLVTNLHADFLNKSVTAGIGLNGGGLLTANITIDFDTVFGDARYALIGRQVLGGLGLTGGGPLSADQTINMGLPTTLDATTTNALTGASHTHEITTGNLNQGANIVLTGNLANRLIGAGNVTIAATAIPWSIVFNRPTTLTGYGITDSLTTSEVTDLLTGKEDVFAKGDLIQGVNIVLTGTLTDRLVGSGNVTIAATAIPWSIVFNRPTTLTGYGITDSLTTSEVTGLLTGKEDVFAKGDLVSGVGISLSGSLVDRLVGTADAIISLATTGVTANTYRSVTVDSYGRVTNGSNPTTIAGYGLTDVYSITAINNLLLGYVPDTRIITINGVSLDLSANRSWTISSGVSGTTGYIPVFTSSTSIGNSVIRDTGSEINIADSRSFGVEGPAAMRDYLHVWGYASFGTASNHGTLILHNQTSAVAASSAALEIRSTTKGFLGPRMTRAQRLAMPSPDDWIVVIQTDVVGTSNSGLKIRYPGGTWFGLTEEPG